MANLVDEVILVSAGATDTFPPNAKGDALHWAGARDVDSVDVELWATAAATVTNAELFSAVQRPQVLADDNADAVTHGADTFTVTGHSYQDGDGPVRVASTTTIPAGLAAATDYWLGVVDANTVKFYSSLANWLAASPVNLTSDGSGTITISDTADTKRVYWCGHGKLGYLGDGAISLTGQRAYVARVSARPRAFAYGLIYSTTAAISAGLFLTRPVK